MIPETIDKYSTIVDPKGGEFPVTLPVKLGGKTHLYFDLEQSFTKPELEHLKMLMGKDIGWQLKYRTGKENLARMIYGNVLKLLKMKE